MNCELTHSSDKGDVHGDSRIEGSWAVSVCHDCTFAVRYTGVHLTRAQAMVGSVEL